jgi:hypothetical protein
VIGSPTREAADLIRRYLAGRGRHDPFNPARDVEALHVWLRATELADQWRRCRSLAGQVTDSGLLAAVRQEHPELVTDIDNRRSLCCPTMSPTRRWLATSVGRRPPS